MVAQVDREYIQARPTRLWSRMVSYLLFEGRPLTTRGQWINPFVFAHFALEKRLPQLKEIVSPVFILGTGRSGTTILGVVLSMHEDVGFLNEPKALWSSLRNDEDLIGSYNRGVARYRLGSDDATPEVIRGAHRVYGAYLRASFCSRVVDKYPELIFRVPFVRRIFPDARFLFLSRDGWDTCSSIEHWSTRLGVSVNGELHDWWGVNGRKWDLLVSQIVPEHADLGRHIGKIRALQDHRAMAAVEWIVTMREGLRLLDERRGDVMHVPYEALCSDPVGMAQRIADFTSLKADSHYVEYARQALSMPSRKAAFELPEYLMAPFMETQRALGCAEELG